MSFQTINQAAHDPALTDRITAAVMQEAWNNPTLGATTYGAEVRLSTVNAVRMAWPVATASDVEAAYASALAAGNPNPGGDEAVITDGMILANVQAKWPPDQPPA